METSAGPDESGESVMLRLMSVPEPTAAMPTIQDVLWQPRAEETEEVEMDIAAYASKRCGDVARHLMGSGHAVMCTAISPEGHAAGLGIRLQPNGTVLTGQFEGRVSCVREAVVTTTRSDQPLVCGQIAHNALNGNAEVALPGVGRYSGTLEDGKPHGVGVWAREDGTWYEGEWRGGNRHGRGTEHYSDCIRYKGQWKDDKYDGEGEMHGPGVAYRGKWAAGVRVGEGEITEASYTREQRFVVQYGDDGVEVSRVTAEQAQIDRLTRQIEDLQSAAAPPAPPPPVAEEARAVEFPCKICFERQIDRVLRPCNHACICSECEARLHLDGQQSSAHPYRMHRIRCPVCRTQCHRAEDIILIT